MTMMPGNMNTVLSMLSFTGPEPQSTMVDLILVRKKRLKSKTLDEWLPASVDMKPSTSKKLVSKPLTQKKEEAPAVKSQQPSQYNACVNTVFKTLADLPETVPVKVNSVVTYFKNLG